MPRAISPMFQCISKQATLIHVVPNIPQPSTSCPLPSNFCNLKVDFSLLFFSCYRPQQVSLACVLEQLHYSLWIVYKQCDKLLWGMGFVCGRAKFNVNLTFVFGSTPSKSCEFLNSSLVSTSPSARPSLHPALCPPRHLSMPSYIEFTFLSLCYPFFKHLLHMSFVHLLLINISCNINKHFIRPHFINHGWTI